jgi:hypothetical protein
MKLTKKNRQIAIGKMEEYKTFKEWSKSGFLILKGSKGKWIEGEVKFSDKQVCPKLTWSDDEWREMGECYGEGNFF